MWCRYLNKTGSKTFPSQPVMPLKISWWLTCECLLDLTIYIYLKSPFRGIRNSCCEDF